MNLHKGQRFLKFVYIVITFVLTLTVMSGGLHAASPEQPQPSKPFGIKKELTRYDINSDGTYTAHLSGELIVLNQTGVQIAGQMPVGMTSEPIFGPEEREVTLLSAYTRKKNGARFDALPGNVPQNVNRSNAMLVFQFEQKQVKIMAFQNVEIGDTLVLDFMTRLKKPIAPGQFAIDKDLSKSEDAEFTLIAPSSLVLKVESTGNDKAEYAKSGNTQKWTWKHKTAKPELLKSDSPASPDSELRIYASTFKDKKDEDAAKAIYAGKMSLAPIPPNKRCQDFPETPYDGPEAMEAYSQRLSFFFWMRENFMRQEVNDLNAPDCVFADGRPRIAALGTGLDQAFKREMDWSKSQARVDYLRKEYPGEAFAAIAQAKFWSAYAWNARGNGYASSVSQDGWKLFHERLENSEQVLLETKSFATKIPEWYVLMLNVKNLLKRPAEDRNQIFIEGVKQYPTYYNLYFAMLRYQMPKWGGSWEGVEDFANWAANNTKAKEGSSLYSRAYWLVSEENPVNIFKDTQAKWPKMKQGFEDMMSKYPKSKWNLNNFAKFSCMADDKKTFLKLRKQIGNDVMRAAWPQNTSLDLCETKFGLSQ